MSTESTLGKGLLIFLGVLMLLGGACFALIGLGSANSGAGAGAIVVGLVAAGIAVLGIVLIVQTAKRR